MHKIATPTQLNGKKSEKDPAQTQAHMAYSSHAHIFTTCLNTLVITLPATQPSIPSLLPPPVPNKYTQAPTKSLLLVIRHTE